MKEIEPLQIVDMSGIDYFKKNVVPKKEKGLFSADLIESHRQNFINLNEDVRNKVVFYYILHKSENGLYKVESSRKMGEYFNCSKTTIIKSINALKNKEYIRELNEIDIQKLKNEGKYYKILKEEWTCGTK